MKTKIDMTPVNVFLMTLWITVFMGGVLWGFRPALWLSFGGMIPLIFLSFKNMFR